MADEIRINTTAAEAALRRLESVMQDWEQNREGIRQALSGVMDSQQADIIHGLEPMIDDFVDKRSKRITDFVGIIIEVTRTYLEDSTQEDARAAQDIRGGKSCSTGN